MLGAGRLVFSGPREALVPFFSWVGLRCPERKNMADFLQEVCSEKDQEVRYPFSSALAASHAHELLPMSKHCKHVLRCSYRELFDSPA